MRSKLHVLNESEAVDTTPILNSVYQLLSEKALFEMKPQDVNNKTVLGGVGFFFHVPEEDRPDDQAMICYDKHHKWWNEKLIMLDIEEYRRYMLKEKGVYIED